MYNLTVSVTDPDKFTYMSRSVSLFKEIILSLYVKQNDIHPLGNKSMWLIKTKIDENRFPPGLTGICLFESLVNLITGKIYIL